MRETTKKRLLAVLEKDLKQVKDRLEARYHDELLKIHDEMGEITQGYLKCRSEKQRQELDTKWAKVRLRRDKLHKIIDKNTKNLSKDFDEKCALEEEIMLLKYVLRFATKNLKFELDYAAAYPNPE